MTHRFDSAANRPLDDLVATFNDAFEGYVGGEVHLDREGFGAFVARQRVDLRLSRVVLDAHRTLALALVSQRGHRRRVAAMGVRSSVAGQGIGTELMRGLIAAARQAGVRSVELEVIEQNPAGVALYRKVGFERVQRLIEFERPPGTSGAPDVAGEAATPDEIDIGEAARDAVVHGEAELPWPVSGFDLVSLGPPARAYRLGPASAIVAGPDDPSAGALRLEALTVAGAARRAGHGRALLSALAARHPHHRWRVVANCPERFRPFLEACGFAPGPLSQLHLRREL